MGGQGGVPLTTRNIITPCHISCWARTKRDKQDEGKKKKRIALAAGPRATSALNATLPALPEKP
jgi:hypothetical protein